MKNQPFKKAKPRRLKAGKTSIAFVVFDDNMAYAAEGWGTNRVYILYCNGAGSNLVDEGFVEEAIMEKAVLPVGVYRADNFDLTRSATNISGVAIGDWEVRLADQRVLTDYDTTIQHLMGCG